MPVTDAITSLHGTPATPSDIFTGTAQYSDSELDFGAAASGADYPYLQQFPSRTEQGYSFPPESLGPGGVEMGVHLIVGAALVPGSMAGGTVNVVSDDTTNATTVIASRDLTNAQLEVAGAHYFIPVPQGAVKEFLRCQFAAGTAGATSGTGYAWFGPRTGGEQ
jgi:hypothetical protein